MANFTASLIICKCKQSNGMAPCCIKRQDNVLCRFIDAFVGIELRRPFESAETTAFAKNRTAP